MIIATTGKKRGNRNVQALERNYHRPWRGSETRNSNLFIIAQQQCEFVLCSLKLWASSSRRILQCSRRRALLSYLACRHMQSQRRTATLCNELCTSMPIIIRYPSDGFLQYPASQSPKRAYLCLTSARWASI